MVTKPNLPVPAAPTPLKKAPKIDPMVAASGFAGTNLPQGSEPLYRETGSPPPEDKKFKLPEKVTQKEIQDSSFRYGGGRSAGHLSTEK